MLLYWTMLHPSLQQYRYSTCGFMVAGLILLAHAPPGNDTWETFDQIAMLGLDKAQFPQLTMAPFGPM